MQVSILAVQHRSKDYVVVWYLDSNREVLLMLLLDLSYFRLLQRLLANLEVWRLSVLRERFHATKNRL